MKEYLAYLIIPLLSIPSVCLGWGAGDGRGFVSVATSGPAPDYNALVDPGGNGDFLTITALLASFTAGALPEVPYIVECISSNDASESAVIIPNTITGASSPSDFIIRGGTGNKATTVFSDTKYRIRVTDGTALTINAPYVTIQNLQVEVEQPSSGYPVAIAAGNDSYVSHILLDGLYVNGNGGRTELLNVRGASGSTVDIRNSIIAHANSGSQTGLLTISSNPAVVTIFNNTIADTNGYSMNQSATGGGANTITNNIFANVGAPAVGDLVYTYNAFDTGEQQGTNAVQVADWTAEFTNEASDYSLLTGATVRGAGVDLSGTFTNDIDQDTRSAWDIGADEF